MASRPSTNSARLRQRLSTVYARATRAGSREFQPSSASRTFSAAVSAVKGGSGGRLMACSPQFEALEHYPIRRLPRPLRYGTPDNLLREPVQVLQLQVERGATP